MRGGRQGLTIAAVIEELRQEDERDAIAIIKRLAASAPTLGEPKLAVWYGPMPESNGKTNWTAILHRGDIASGMTIDRSEYPDRVRYEADRVRWLIGELADEPFIPDYDADKNSGYVAQQPKAAEPKGLTDDMILDEYSKHAIVNHYNGINVLSAMEPEGFIKGVRALLAKGE